jgi:HSP20 family protein
VSAPPPPDGLDEIIHAVEATTREAPGRTPAMEIIEEPGCFILVADVPGAEREDIRVDVSPHRVVIAALPRTGVEALRTRAGNAPYVEFERAVPLPSEVRPEDAEARLNNGVLEVVLPKKAPGGVGVYRLPTQ